MSIELWTLVVGSLVPLVTYVVNNKAPWASEPVKAAVLVVTAAVAGSLYLQIQDGSIGFNETTLHFALIAVVGALTSHGFLWRPSGVSVKLGGGSNS